MNYEIIVSLKWILPYELLMFSTQRKTSFYAQLALFKRHKTTKIAVAKNGDIHIFM